MLEYEEEEHTLVLGEVVELRVLALLAVFYAAGTLVDLFVHTGEVIYLFHGCQPRH